MDYGIANQKGKPDFQGALDIVRTASEAGVDTFDTATAYGDSEQVLGDAFKKLEISGAVRVMSKLGHDAFVSVKSCVAATEQCLERLQVTKLELMFAHSAQSVADPATEKCFAALKKEGFIAGSGVSVYSAQDALSALQLPEIDTVQMPLNVFDQQALTQGVIERARSSGKKLIFRSVFLQGLLILPPDKLPERMSFASEFVCAWNSMCERLSVPPRVMALQCALSMAGGMPLLIGCESAVQLQENIDALNYRASHVDEALAETAKLALRIPEALRNPSLWPTQ